MTPIPRLPLRLWVCLLAAATGLPAGALDVGGALSEELTVGQSKKANSADATRFFGNLLTGTLELGEKWAFDLAWAASKSDGPGVLSAFNLTASFAPSEKWFLMGGVKWGPALPNVVDMCVPREVVDPAGAGTIQLKVCGTSEEQVSSVGPGLVGGYESAGEGDFGWGVDAGVSANWYSLKYTVTDINAVSIIRPTGAEPAPPLVVDLARRAAVGTGKNIPFQQYRFGLGLAFDLFQHYSVGLRGAYYLYVAGTRDERVDSDALQHTFNATMGGFPLAPLDWEIGPTGKIRFSRKLSLDLSATLAKYSYECNGGTLMAMVKLTGKPGKFRLWGAVTIQVDGPPQSAAAVAACKPGVAEPKPDPATTYGFGSVGVEYSF